MIQSGPILVFASFNREKAWEYAQLFSDVNVSIKTLHDFEDQPEFSETGASLSENAAIKSRVAAAFYNLPAFSDDTGLEVFALDGAPGVYSSRYAGPEASYQDNVNKLLHELRDVPFDERGARFRTVICLSVPQKNRRIKDFFFEGGCDGLITTEPRGLQGFGYDAVFYVPTLNLTLGEAGEAMKNQVSHRAVAAQALIEFLDEHNPFLNIVQN